MSTRDIDSIESFLDAVAGRPSGVAAAPASRPRKVSDGSVVFSIRLGQEELDELRFRAEVVSLPPATLARLFVRRGLAREDDVAGEDETVGDLVYRLARDAAALRRLLQVEAPPGR